MKGGRKGAAGEAGGGGCVLILGGGAHVWPGLIPPMCTLFSCLPTHASEGTRSACMPTPPTPPPSRPPPAQMSSDWAGIIDNWAVRFFHEMDYNR